MVYPDWSRGQHHAGIITRCSITRTRERVYDVEFEDGIKLFAVREEYIRVTNLGIASEEGKDNKRGIRKGDRGGLLGNYAESIRVHVKIQGKSSKQSRYVPGRIKKVNASGNTYDVECEGGRLERGVPSSDILCGLEEGFGVEARRPKKISLQSTGVSWSCTGSALAVAFGQLSVSGWCQVPGAVCVWSLFSRQFNPDCPDFVLDHSCSIQQVCYHPEVPSLLAGGTFDGEVLIWDLSSKTPDQPIFASASSEHASKEPILGIKWVFDATLDQFILCTVAADGLVLFWRFA